AGRVHTTHIRSRRRRRASGRPQAGARRYAPREPVGVRACPRTASRARPRAALPRPCRRFLPARGKAAVTAVEKRRFLGGAALVGGGAAGAGRAADIPRRWGGGAAPALPGPAPGGRPRAPERPR